MQRSRRKSKETGLFLRLHAGNAAAWIYESPQATYDHVASATIAFCFSKKFSFLFALVYVILRIL